MPILSILLISPVPERNNKQIFDFIKPAAVFDCGRFILKNALFANHHKMQRRR